MKSTTKAMIAAAFAVAVAAALIFWQAKGGFARNVNLTPQDMSLLVEGLQPQLQMTLARSEEQRKEFAKNVREVFALAEEGRKLGYADKPEVKRQLELMRQLIIGRAYLTGQQKDGKTPEQLAPKEELDNFLKEPGREQEFDAFVQDLQKMGMIPAGMNIPEEQKQGLKEDWARNAIFNRKGVAAGLDKDPKTQLQIKFQEALVIAREYSKEFGEKLKATDEEVKQYIASHPELDPSKARGQAEDVLKRVRGGEDFAALAKEFSGDPGSKEEGGDLGWFGRGRMMKSFEEAAFNLQPGQISDLVETPYGFHIIKVEERGTKDGPEGKPEEQVHARHILIKSGSTNQFGMPQPPEEQARAAVEEEKRNKHLEDILKRTKVTVPDNYEVKMPEMPRPQMPVMPPPGEDDGHGHAPESAPPPRGDAKPSPPKKN